MRVPVIKIHTLQAPPFAWAFAGDSNPGDPFNAWLESREWPSGEGWETFAGAARDVLARENQAHAERLAAQGKSAGTRDRAEILIAGYLQHEARILHLPTEGEPVWCTDEHYPSIGSGLRRVRQAHWNLNVDYRAEAGFLRTLLEQVVALEPGSCGLPIRIMEVSRGGARPIV